MLTTVLQLYPLVTAISDPLITLQLLPKFESHCGHWRPKLAVKHFSHGTTGALSVEKFGPCTCSDIFVTKRC